MTHHSSSVATPKFGALYSDALCMRHFLPELVIVSSEAEPPDCDVPFV